MDLNSVEVNVGRRKTGPELSNTEGSSGTITWSGPIEKASDFNG